MKLELSTQIEIERVQVFAELATLVRRPELGMLCWAAAEGGRIDAEVVARVLPGVGPAGAENVVRGCREMGLCDRAGELTRVGAQTATTDEAPEPEQGVYELWMASHPLLGRRVVHMARVSPDRGADFELLAPLPFEPERALAFTSVVEPGLRVIVREFPSLSGEPRCVRRTPTTLELRWRWDLDDGTNRWWLAGALAGAGGRGRDKGRARPAQVRHDGESAPVDVNGLFAAVAERSLRERGRWDRELGRLRIAAAGLSEDAEERFAIDQVDLGAVEVSGYGRFESATVRDLAIAPADGDAAASWARSCFERRLARAPRHRTRGDVHLLWSAQVVGTPLAEFAPPLPAHHELLARAAELGAERYWHLCAAVDLAPTPVPEADLAPLPPRTDVGAEEVRT
ncbi:hypothetical protein [Haliangium sp.]|uniref:hypothetical protein n=1 Tax=Haliangium sp. TaxID=2663208 RepID=UPI003D10B6F6